MPFFSGRVTFLRFKVDGPSPRTFTDDHLDRLRQNGHLRGSPSASEGDHSAEDDHDQADGEDDHLRCNSHSMDDDDIIEVRI